MDEFINAIESSDITAIVNIKDDLKLCLKDDRQTPVGRLEITKEIRAAESEYINVNIVANAKIDSLLSSSTIFGKVNRKNFAVVEQTHDEGIEQVVGEFVNKTTTIHTKDDILFVEQRPRKETCQYHITQKILAETGSFVFEALLARVGFHKEIQLPWFDRSNCKKLSQVLYRPLADKVVIALDGSTTTAYGVEKIITRFDDDGKQSEKFTWFSYYSKLGALLEREQQDDTSHSTSSVSDKDFLSPALPFYAIVESIPGEDDNNSENERTRNENQNTAKIDVDTDVQMQSELHRLKNLHKAHHTTYLKQNPVVMEIISDLTQHLLIHKPENPMEEIHNYFSA